MWIVAQFALQKIPHNAVAILLHFQCMVSDLTGVLKDSREACECTLLANNLALLPLKPVIKGFEREPNKSPKFPPMEEQNKKAQGTPLCLTYILAT